MFQAICRCILVVSLLIGGGSSFSNAQSPKELTNSIGMKLMLIPKGTFMMRSEIEEERIEEGRASNNEEEYQVTISKDYYLGVTEVTQGQYEKVMGTIRVGSRVTKSRVTAQTSRSSKFRGRMQSSFAKSFRTCPRRGKRSESIACRPKQSGSMRVVLAAGPSIALVQVQSR
jgi:formylglycine-generating enzyme required for sulfatase activity